MPWVYFSSWFSLSSTVINLHNGYDLSLSPESPFGESPDLKVILGTPEGDWVINEKCQLLKLWLSGRCEQDVLETNPFAINCKLVFFKEKMSNIKIKVFKKCKGASAS